MLSFLKPCTKFFSTAGCRFGDGCHFLHYVPKGYNVVAQMSGNPAHAPASRNPVGLPPLSDGSPTPAAKTRLCNKFNTSDGCKFGEKYCHFAHVERELGGSLLSGHEAPIAPSIGGRFEPPPPPGLGASATEKISVDVSLAADAIIGKGGVNTKQVCRLTGATNLKNIELEGTFEQIKQAPAAMVQKLIVNRSSSAVPVKPGGDLGAAVGGGGGGGDPGHGPGSNFKTKLCENFTKGTCTFGVRCHFAHGGSELRKAAA